MVETVEIAAATATIAVDTVCNCCFIREAFFTLKSFAHKSKTLFFMCRWAGIVFGYPWSVRCKMIFPTFLKG